MERVADAVIESGMRAAIAKSTMDMGNAITGAMKETASEAIDHTKELYKNYQGSRRWPCGYLVCYSSGNDLLQRSHHHGR